MFIPIERWTSILEKVEREVFLLNPNQQNLLSQQGEWFILPNHENKEDYYVNPCLCQLKDELKF